MATRSIQAGTRVKILSGRTPGIDFRGMTARVSTDETVRLNSESGKVEPMAVVTPVLGGGRLGTPFDFPVHRLRGEGEAPRVGFFRSFEEGWRRALGGRRTAAAVVAS